MAPTHQPTNWRRNFDARSVHYALASEASMSLLPEYIEQRDHDGYEGDFDEQAMAERLGYEVPR
jgi:hypothetical protein